MESSFEYLKKMPPQLLAKQLAAARVTQRWKNAAGTLTDLLIRDRTTHSTVTTRADNPKVTTKPPYGSLAGPILPHLPAAGDCKITYRPYPPDAFSEWLPAIFSASDRMSAQACSLRRGNWCRLPRHPINPTLQVVTQAGRPYDSTQCPTTTLQPRRSFATISQAT